ncbi:hypothetical protein HY837_02295 [archaeon]|nr:hypothetical protein [archaeon]
MKLVYSYHWFCKKKYRKDIFDDFLEYAILNSKIIRDKYWKDAYNAVIRIPLNGRTLKVIYKLKGGNIYKIISAYWLD